MHFALLYDVVPDHLERRGPYRAEHLALAERWRAEGKLLLAGALGEPLGSLLVFRVESAAEVEEFAKADPYVRAGLVTAWQVRPWTVVVGGDAAPARRLVDLSHEVTHGMTTYRGLPGPLLSEHLSREASRARYAAGTEFLIGRIDMVSNTGTYVDSPFHRYPGGKDLADLPLASLADLPGLVVRAPWRSGREVGPAAFQGLALRGKAVLVHTGWDEHWGSERYGDPASPCLTEAAARLLADEGASLVGIDAHNIDDTSGGERPVHSTLLGRDIPVCEHLCNLAALPGAGFRFTAAPVKVRAFGTFPVRAFAVLG